LSLYLVERGWDVTVYCQGGGEGPVLIDKWRGVKRITIPVAHDGGAATVIFDWRSIQHLISTNRKFVLTLGYNTALFCSLYRFKGIVNVINMDGIEWKRDKWRWHERIWLWLNELAGCRVGNHLVADHPEIANHLQSRVRHEKITMIPYGSDGVSGADVSLLKSFGLEKNAYALVVARPEPENSILEIVSAFCRRKRDCKLVVLGNFDSSRNEYHRRVLAAADHQVVFPGAVYEKPTVSALRYFCRLYIHGHTVGGTNPSLVEALGAGSAVLAHDNRFNRWVAGPDAEYFRSLDHCGETLDRILCDESKLNKMAAGSLTQWQKRFTWENVLTEYEQLLTKWLPPQAASTSAPSDTTEI
jgi:glycosyltransferase involved in cell wall biosynthesis